MKPKINHPNRVYDGTAQYWNTGNKYPIRVFLMKEGDHFHNMVKRYRHFYTDGWACIQFPDEEDMLAFSLMLNVEC